MNDTDWGYALEVTIYMQGNAGSDEAQNELYDRVGDSLENLLHPDGMVMAVSPVENAPKWENVT